jgi:hypothetical protein
MRQQNKSPGKQFNDCNQKDNGKDALNHPGKRRGNRNQTANPVEDSEDQKQDKKTDKQREHSSPHDFFDVS